MVTGVDWVTAVVVVVIAAIVGADATSSLLRFGFGLGFFGLDFELRGFFFFPLTSPTSPTRIPAAA